MLGEADSSALVNQFIMYCSRASNEGTRHIQSKPEKWKHLTARSCVQYDDNMTGIGPLELNPHFLHQVRL